MNKDRLYRDFDRGLWWGTCVSLEAKRPWWWRLVAFFRGRK